MGPHGRDATKIGRIDVHCHLLPGIDDGCQTPAESIACAAALVAAGYTHSFCTPHIWPSVPHNTVANIPNYVAQLQERFDDANVPLKLLSGGELNLRPGFTDTAPAEIVSYGMARKYVLIDFWSDRLPENFEPSMRWLQSLGMTVVLAHPERIRAIQDKPDVLDLLAEMGLLLQGNLQCLGDPQTAPTRRLAERFLLDGRYFMLGSDTHGHDTLPIRLKGLARAIEMVGEEAVMRLTRDNPLQLVPEGFEL
jgi:protein-tyrosine phosphatase